MEAKRKLTRGKLWAESGGIGFRKNCVFRTLSEALELRRVEEAKDPRHRELRHREEERAEGRNGHHQVEVNQQIGDKLCESLNDRRADNSDARILAKRSGDLRNYGLVETSQLAWLIS